MTGLQAGSLPDRVQEPVGDVRGTVVVLAGSGETERDFGYLTDHLTLADFRVEIFADVSIDPLSSRLGVLSALEDPNNTGPLFLVGSDVGATLAAQIAVSDAPPVDALVLGSLSVRGPRLPRGVSLPQARALLVPTLVFHGDADEVTDVADAVSWATQLPFGTVRLVPHGEHGLLGGDQRRTIAASTLLFFERHRAGEAVLSDGFAPSPGRDA
ncbi:hypothetical protein GCM10025780_15270 [Frondihabitans cladoniiphilus]|uniref:Alpha/beta hydrolase n=1 Tax=Frondihabitans cladoniiphilus TaxID=715785 RepID=A0ABP8VW75_9MICO